MLTAEPLWLFFTIYLLIGRATFTTIFWEGTATSTFLGEITLIKKLLHCNFYLSSSTSNFCNKNDKFPEKLQSDEAGLVVGVLEAGLAAGDDVELVIR